MSLKDTLTNEQLNQRFGNPFALVNYAIRLARAQVARGEEWASNPANEILTHIADDGVCDGDEDDQSEE